MFNWNVLSRVALPFATCLLLVGSGAAHGQVQPQPPADFQALCEANLRPTRIDVTVSPLQYGTTQPYSIAQLTIRSGHSVGTGHQAWTMGLTESDNGTYFGFNVDRLNRADGWSCIRPQFHIRVEVSPQRVYVASEFPRGTCSYNEILAHELRHVRVNQSHAQEAALAFQAEIRAAFGNNIYYGTSAALESQLRQVIHDGWMPRLQARLGEVAVLQAQIDTPEEYARMGQVCSGEVQRMLHAISPY